jgi:hypothetical protein
MLNKAQEDTLTGADGCQHPSLRIDLAFPDLPVTPFA